MVTSSPTLAQIESVTREGILQSVLRYGRFGVYGTITATGNTTTITDTTRLKSTQYNDQDWVGGWARISYDAGGAAAAPETEIRPITAYAPSTGIITVNPAFSAAPTTNDRYELWKFPDPQVVIDTLDELMQEEIWLPSWTMLSEIPDGDMEQGNTTDWTDSGATGSKVSSEPAMVGGRWLEVVGVSALDYTRSAVMNVQSGQAYYAGALCIPIGAFTARLIAYDETNSATIDSVDFNGRYLAGIGFDFKAPATCEQVSLRLAGVESSATIRWDEVVMYPHTTPDIALPWWVKNKDQVKSLFRFERWQEGSSVRFPRLVRGIDNTYGFMDDAFGRGQLRLFKTSGQLPMPLMMYGTRNPAAFTNDTTDTRRIDKNYLKAGLLYKLFQQLNNGPISARLETTWLESKQDEWTRAWTTASYGQMERIEQTLQGQSEYRNYA